MQDYPIDIEPEQVVRWIIAEHQVAPSKFKVVARRHVETRELPARKELRLGDEERADVSETAIVVTLQIAPAHPKDGWLMTVSSSRTKSVRSAPMKMKRPRKNKTSMSTPSTKNSCAGRGSANVSAEADGPGGKARLTRLINDIERDRHGSGSA